jgi:hypothetical protein
MEARSVMREPSRSQPKPAVLERKESRFDWVRASVLAGFCATFAMTVSIAIGYLIANALGSPSGSGLDRWLWALTENELIENVGGSFGVGMVLNLIVGLVWAVIYGRFAEPALSGPGWRKGIMFSIVPWLLSLVVFFPVMGVGLFGMDLDAGPLPVLGNLIVHLVYGAVLGIMFGIEEGEGNVNNASQHATSASAERGAAIGVLAGGVVGFIGGWIVAPTLSDLAGQPVIALAGALSGAAMGAMIGSLVSMRDDPTPDTTSTTSTTVIRDQTAVHPDRS